jgi:hypothetical protein
MSQCRFVDFQPPKITSLAFSHTSKPDEPVPDSLLLAVGRSNGDIDIWSPFYDWVQITVQPFWSFLILDSERWQGALNRRTCVGSPTGLPKETFQQAILSRSFNISNRMGHCHRPPKATSFRQFWNLVRGCIPRW